MPFTSNKQTGYLLLEILLTIGILAVGLLGISAMQMTSMKSSYSAIQRGEAAILVAAMTDRMRANPRAFWNKTTSNDIEYNSLPTGSRAEQDVQEWGDEINATFGVHADGSSVAAGTVDCITKVNCILKIEWNDPRTDAALNPDEATRSSTNPYRYQHVVSVIF